MLVLLTMLTTSSPVPAPAEAAEADAVRDILAPALAAQLQELTAGERIPVIIRFGSLGGLDSFLSQRRDISPYARFRLFPGIAAELTRAQIELLKSVPGVVRVEEDPEITVRMDTAAHWFGTLPARRATGLDGDRDGNPRRYSTEDVVVAVIDTGIDGRHVDLDGGKIIGWRDFVNGRPQPYDDNGHGTHVAGIIAGEGDGDARYQGVAPGAALVGVKVLNAMGSGRGSDLINGIEWVIDNKDRLGIDIISMSLGTSQASDGRDAMSQAINRAVEAGLIAVVAAGNSGPALRTIGSPGAAAGAITVCAMADVGANGFALADFSSRGPTLDGRTKPDICAPGWEITAPRANSSRGYITHSGTSMATPFVSGTVALMLDANPSLGPSEVRRLLTETAVDWGVPGPDVDTGAGRLDGFAAVMAAAGRRGDQAGAPALPAHRVIQDRVEQAVRSYPIQVTTTDYPLAITMITPDWQRSGGPDLDLSLYDPNGNRVAASATNRRQETIRYRPARTGTYTLRVEARNGTPAGSRIVIDVSGGLAGAATPPSPAPPPPNDPAPTPPPGDPTPPAPPPDDPGGNPGEDPDNGQGSAQLERRGNLAAGETRHERFTVLGPGTLELTLAAQGGPVVAALYAPDGRRISPYQWVGSGGTVSWRAAAPAAGAYRVDVNAPQGAASYRLVISGRALTTRSGRVDAAATRRTHTFTAAAGGQVEVTLKRSVSGLVAVTLIDPSGRPRSQRWALNGDIVVTSPATPGTWRVQVDAWWLPQGALDYRLEISAPAPLLR